MYFSSYHDTREKARQANRIMQTKLGQIISITHEGEDRLVKVVQVIPVRNVAELSLATWIVDHGWVSCYVGELL